MGRVAAWWRAAAYRAGVSTLYLLRSHWLAQLAVWSVVLSGLSLPPSSSQYIPPSSPGVAKPFTPTLTTRFEWLPPPTHTILNHGRLFDFTI